MRHTAPSPSPFEMTPGRHRRWIAVMACALAMTAADCTPQRHVATPSAPPGHQTRDLTRRPSPAETVKTPDPTLATDTRPAHAQDAAPPIVDLPYARLIDPSRDVPGSLSMGSTADGFLLRHAQLPVEGQHHAVLPKWRARRTHYGTEELVAILLHTGQQVRAEHDGGPRLMLGNLSVAGGGDIEWSRSHNSGRDADIAFYVLKDGEPVEAPSLLSFGPDLRSGAYTFDVPRNWSATKALLTHPEIQVQWLFVATWLKEAMLQHARENHEPEALIERAEQVLWQPTDSTPHKDHLHLRIYCSKEDLLEGCLNSGPVWAWIDTYEAAFEARVTSLIKGLGDPDPVIRRQVLAYMKRIEAREAASAVAQVTLFDPVAELREDSFDLLERWHPRERVVYTALETFIRSPGGGVAVDDPTFTFTTRPTADDDAEAPASPQADGDPSAQDPSTQQGAAAQEQRDDAPSVIPAPPPWADPFTEDPHRSAEQLKTAWHTVKRLAHHRSVPLILQALGSERRIGASPERSVHERTLAANAAAGVMNMRLGPALIDALDTADPDARVAAGDALRRLTNHSFGVKWERRMSQRQRRDAVGKWRRWWKEFGKMDRDAMVLRGFNRARVRVNDLTSHRSIDKLIKVIKRDDHIGYNAARVVAARTKRWYALAERDPEVRSRRWTRWWRKNKGRMRRQWR